MGDVHSASFSFFGQCIFTGSCNGIFGLIPASQAWFTGSFGEVFELSNIFFPLICYLPNGSLRGIDVFFLSICYVFAPIHLSPHLYFCYFKKKVKKEASSSGYTITKCAYYLYVFSPNIHFNKLFFCLKFSALVLLIAIRNLALLPTYIQSNLLIFYQISPIRNMERTIIKASKLH